MKLFNHTNIYKDPKPKIKSESVAKVKIISFFAHFKTYVSYYIAITTALGALWGGFVIYDNWKDSNIKIQDSVKTIISTQIRQEKTDSLLLRNQIEIRDDLNLIKDNNARYIERNDALQRSYIKYISNDKALTKTDFLEYMEGLNIDSKKN
jgi:hypothetical protein